MLATQLSGYPKRRQVDAMNAKYWRKNAKM